MDLAARGRKHVCPECEGKYYDLGKKVVVCPKCGAKPAASKLPRSGQPVKKAGGMPIKRYP